jgi:hypothetical protein
MYLLLTYLNYLPTYLCNQLMYLLIYVANLQNFQFAKVTYDDQKVQMNIFFRF